MPSIRAYPMYGLRGACVTTFRFRPVPPNSQQVPVPSLGAPRRQVSPFHPSGPLRTPLHTPLGCGLSAIRADDRPSMTGVSFGRR
eukprot:467279-Prorocentrum_minimum.AAC.2